MLAGQLAAAPAVSTPSVLPGQPPKHVASQFPTAVVTPADFRPHKGGQQITQTAGMSPDPPDVQQAAAEVLDTVPYAGDSPTGFDPYTLGTF